MLKKCLLAIVTIVVLVGTATACKVPTRDEMRASDYGSSTEAEVSQLVIDDIALLFDNIRDGLETGDANGEISQTFSEAQLTALIAQKIGEAPDSQISNVLINIDPDVVLMAADLLKDGEIKAVVAEFTFETSADGETIAMTLGSFTVDGLLASLIPAVKTQFKDQLNSGLQSAMDDPDVVMSAIPVPTGATVDSITLALGEMTIIGTVTEEALTE